MILSKVTTCKSHPVRGNLIWYGGDMEVTISEPTENGALSLLIWPVKRYYSKRGEDSSPRWKYAHKPLYENKFVAIITNFEKIFGHSPILFTTDFYPFYTPGKRKSHRSAYVSRRNKTVAMVWHWLNRVLLAEVLNMWQLYKQRSKNIGKLYGCLCFQEESKGHNCLTLVK